MSASPIADRRLRGPAGPEREVIGPIGGSAGGPHKSVRFRNLCRVLAGLLHRPLVGVNRVVQSVSESEFRDRSRVGSRTKRARPAAKRSRCRVATRHLVCPEARSMEPGYNIGEYVEIDGPVVLPLFEGRCGRSLPKPIRCVCSFRKRPANRGRRLARRRMVAADHRRQLRKRRARRGRSLDEGRPGAAGRSGVRAAVWLCAVQGVGHALLLVRALSPHRARRFRHVAGRPPRRRGLYGALRRARRARWRVRSACGAARRGRHLSRVRTARTRPRLLERGARRPP